MNIATNLIESHVFCKMEGRLIRERKVGEKRQEKKVRSVLFLWYFLFRFFLPVLRLLICDISFGFDSGLRLRI